MWSQIKLFHLAQREKELNKSPFIHFKRTTLLIHIEAICILLPVPPHELQTCWIKFHRRQRKRQEALVREFSKYTIHFRQLLYLVPLEFKEVFTLYIVILYQLFDINEESCSSK